MRGLIAAVSIVLLFLLECDAPTAAADGKPETSPEPMPAVVERMRHEGWKKPKIPQPEDIESITAECYSHFLPVANVSPFVVPKKYYHDLLEHFHDAEPDKLAHPLDEELGAIRIQLVSGKSIRICWFWEGQGYRLCFSWCGMRYCATGKRFAKDETLAVDALVRRICRIEVFHEDGTSEPIWFPTPKPKK